MTCVRPHSNFGENAKPQFSRGRRKWDMEKLFRSRQFSEDRVPGSRSVRTQYDMPDFWSPCSVAEMSLN